ncbi:Hypothetical protein FKW44_008397, partial [Caligus rogercresseyi]
NNGEVREQLCTDLYYLWIPRETKVYISKVKAIEFTILNSKALVVKKLTSRELLLPIELGGIIVAAVTRYAAFSTPIPDASGDNWTVSSVKSIFLIDLYTSPQSC